MTVTTNDRRIQYTATASQTIFPYDFPIAANTEIEVKQTVNTTGVTSTLTLTTDYTVSGVGDVGGGNITLVTGAAVNDTITITGATPLARTTDFSQAGDFLASDLNSQLDTQIKILQENETQTSRAVLLKDEDTSTTVELPIATDRASKFLAFDASGDAIAAAGTTGVTVSSYMETVLDDADAATARTTLGLTSGDADVSLNVLNLEVEPVQISSGAITRSGSYMRVDTEGLASTDNLSTINGGADGDVLFIRPAASARDIIIEDNATSGGNILMTNNKDVTLENSSDLIGLIYRADDGFWLPFTIQTNNVSISKLSFAGKTSTISSGAVTFNTSYMVVDTEGAASTDDLDTINGGVLGDIVKIRQANNARDVTIKHGTGNILLTDNMDLEFTETTDFIELVFIGSQWIEASRSRSLDFSSSHLINGYTYLPNGIILQWGEVTGVPTNGTKDVTLPITFPNNFWSVTNAPENINMGELDGDSFCAEIINTSTIRFKNNMTVATRTGTWFAIGN